MESAPNIARSNRRFVKLGAAILVACAALGLLLFSFQPSVPAHRRPTAQSIEAARGAVRQLKQAQVAGNASAPVLLDNGMLEGMAALANDLISFGRADAKIVGDVLIVRVSIAFFPRLWLNTSATVVGEQDGFPELALKAGRLSLPPGAGRPFAELARSLMRLRGVRVPPLDVLVRKLDVDQNRLSAELSLPRKTGLVDDVVGVSKAKVDQALVAQIYCRLAASQRAEPVTDLAQVVRSVFRVSGAGNASEFNRAAFVALSFYVVGEQARSLAPRAEKMIRSCTRPNEPVLLSGRPDLAKHWALSAALRAVLGERSAATLGEWKELSDSLPGGSGFSFIDLAADRSGILIASRGVTPALARGTARKLAKVSNDDLLPRSLMQVREGLSEADFVDQYGAVDTKDYLAVVQRIDAELRKQD